MPWPRSAERRDLRKRGELLAKVTVWLGLQRSPILNVPDEMAEPATGQRILRSLVVRGLARRVAEGWLPALVLTCLPPLHRVAPEI
jgi:hypothetical protein